MACTVQCNSIRFNAVETIIFDKDGTLADANPYLYQLARLRSRLLDAKIPGVQESLLIAYGVEGHHLDPQGLLAVGSRQEDEIAAAAFVAETGRGWAEARRVATEAYAEADHNMPPKPAATPLFAEAEHLIQRLQPHTVRLAMMSADTTQNVVAFAQHYGLTGAFEGLVGVDTVDKKDGKACRHFLEKQGINPKTTLVIGDSDADMGFAQTIGAFSIGATWGWQQPYPIRGADAIASSPHDIEIYSCERTS